VSLGSGLRSNIRIPDHTVSAIHCCLRFDGVGLKVEDRDSTNGLKVNGRDVQNSRVEPGDVLYLGTHPVLVAERIGDSRCADAITWQGIVARDVLSLWMLCDLAKMALSSAPLWIHGESGTGKEGIARAIHLVSPRANEPWVAINCAAMPEALAEAELFGVARGAYTGADRSREGAFRRADGGTILLDEVGELSPSVQAKLLRVLETGEVLPVGGERVHRINARIVTATWRDLNESVAEGMFRFDLLQRLWVLKLEAPPLRRRSGDIVALLHHFLKGEGCEEMWPDPSLLASLVGSAWPGNVRQLRNHVLRATATDDISALTPSEVGVLTRLMPRRGSVSNTVGFARIHAELSRTRGNRTEAARSLGISRSTLYRWMRDWQIAM